MGAFRLRSGAKGRIVSRMYSSTRMSEPANRLMPTNQSRASRNRLIDTIIDATSGRNATARQITRDRVAPRITTGVIPTESIGNRPPVTVKVEMTCPRARRFGEPWPGNSPASRPRKGPSVAGAWDHSRIEGPIEANNDRRSQSSEVWFLGTSSSDTREMLRAGSVSTVRRNPVTPISQLECITV